MSVYRRIADLIPSRGEGRHMTQTGPSRPPTLSQFSETALSASAIRYVNHNMHDAADAGRMCSYPALSFRLLLKEIDA